MPDEDCDEDCNEYDDYDANRSGVATRSTVVYNYWAISHSGSCSFPVAVARLYPRSASVYRMTLAGLMLAVIIAVFALWRSTRTGVNYYETHVYGMTAATHRRYAAVSLLFAALFCTALFVTALPAVPLLAVYVLIAIFYFSSFARGFSDEE